VRPIHHAILTAAFSLILATNASGAQSVSQLFADDDLREIANPERGLYFHVGSQSEQNPIQPWMTQYMQNNNMTLMLRLYYLKSFRDQPLSQTQLDLISNDFAAMRQAGIKTVLRFAYSEGIGEPDAPLNVVLGHMDQLAPIFAANSDVIATAQAGFVGAWGEWHSSTNNLTDPVNARQIVDKWMDILPANRAIQLRTPAQKWMILNNSDALTPGEAFTGTDKSRIGHHNDCFLASETDFGTYANPVAEKAWVGAETQYVPMGGETCAVSSRSDSATARVEMEQLHYSYLNSGYHPDVLAGWEADGFMDEVKRKLGYRFALESIDYEPTVLAGDQLPLTIDLVNNGWASPFNPRDVVLTLVSEDGLTEYDFTLPDDPRTWLPGNTITLSALVDIPADAVAGNYQLWLSFPDPEPTLANRPEYAIQLANPGLWNPATGRHDLGITVSIAALINGDLNGDGFVGVDDLNIVLSNWNLTVTPGDLLSGDATGEGFVGVDDLNLILSNWNAGAPPTDVATDTVPEPGTLSLICLTATLLLQRRSSK
jgi:Domain of unknown function (DUF4832)/Domain of unknown function (DUF4874)